LELVKKNNIAYIVPKTIPCGIRCGFSTGEGTQGIIDASRTIKAHQVHGSMVQKVGKKDMGKTISKCDGLISEDPGIILTIKTADCIPLLLYCTKPKVIAVLHGGWRGLSQNIIKNCLQRLKQDYSCDSKQIQAYIGPCISWEIYEVDAQVRDTFAQMNLIDQSTCYSKGQKYHINLSAIAKKQLMLLDVEESRIKIYQGCTYSDKNFFSYRRDPEETRRQWAFIEIL